MSIYEFAAILALTGYAVYQQTHRHEVVAARRFKLAITYGVAGLVIGGIQFPHSGVGVTFLAISVALSLLVGQIRGRLTRLWVENGAVYSQGTTLTVSLFLALIASKFALGTVAYLLHADRTGGIGEVLLMLAAMLAIQAQLIHGRAQRLVTTAGAVPVAGAAR